MPKLHVVSDYEVVTGSNVIPGPSTGVPFTFVHNKEPYLHASSVRPVGFPVTRNVGQIAWLDSKDEAHKLPLTVVPGFDVLEERHENFPVVIFRYYKQWEGMEDSLRLVALKATAYGTHIGHMGDEEREVAPEKPGWYMVADMLGTVSLDGQVARSEVIKERHFPFARIIGGPMGDPLMEDFRQQQGIY